MSRFIAALAAAVFGFACIPAIAQPTPPAKDQRAESPAEKKVERGVKKAKKKARKAKRKVQPS